MHDCLPLSFKGQLNRKQSRTKDLPLRARLAPQFTPNPSSTPHVFALPGLGVAKLRAVPPHPHSFGHPQGHWVASHIRVSTSTGHKNKDVASWGHSSLAPPCKLYFSWGSWWASFLARKDTGCHASCNKAQVSCQP